MDAMQCLLTIASTCVVRHGKEDKGMLHVPGECCCRDLSAQEAMDALSYVFLHRPSWGLIA